MQELMAEMVMNPRSQKRDLGHPAEGKFVVHDFVVMPDHLHLLLEVDHKTTIEKAVQFIKGRYSHRIKSECQYLGEVWQRGFAEKQVKTEAEMAACRKYIALNPVKAGLATEIDEYPFCFLYLARIKQGLKTEGK